MDATGIRSGAARAFGPCARRIRWRGDPGRGTPPPPGLSSSAPDAQIRMPMAYLTVAGRVTAEVEVSSSRFLCALERVEDEISARGVIEQARKDHWAARHHCSAYVLGPERAVERSNDDGEPPGTGGAPMLEVLRGRELSDVVAVVTRWFGGTLLGTGGLSRAYADAVRAALEVTPLVQRVEQELCEVTVDLAAAGRLEHELRSRGTKVLHIDYTDVATLSIAVPAIAVPIAEGVVAEVTEGGAVLYHRGRRWVDAPVSTV